MHENFPGQIICEKVLLVDFGAEQGVSVATITLACNCMKNGFYVGGFCDKLLQ